MKISQVIAHRCSNARIIAEPGIAMRLVEQGSSKSDHGWWDFGEQGLGWPKFVVPRLRVVASDAHVGNAAVTKAFES